MRDRIKRLVVLPFSIGCISESSIAVGEGFPDGLKHNERLTPMRTKEADHEEAEKYTDEEDLKSSLGLLSFPKFQRLVKNFKNLSHLFGLFKHKLESYKDDEMEDEDFSMEIGLPTDIKHVTHIGIDGSATSILSRGWDNFRAPDFRALAPPVHYRSSSDFQAGPARDSPLMHSCTPPSLSGMPLEVPPDRPAPSIHFVPSPFGKKPQICSAVHPTRSPFAMPAQAPYLVCLAQLSHSIPAEGRQLNVKGA